MTRKFFSSLAAAFSLALTASQTCGAAQAGGASVKITDLSDKLRIELNGSLLTEYHFKGAPHLYYYPLLGPGQVPLTRNFPMKSVEGEEKDHPHHRSLWFSHGSVNGIDFWSEAKGAGRIEHGSFLEKKDGPTGMIRSQNNWVGPDGKVMCRDETTFRIVPMEKVICLEFEVKLMAPADQEVVLGDTKEGTMAVRVAESMRLKHNKSNTGKPTGHIVQSTGVRDEATWGKRAEWCDYHGPVDGKIMGIAMFDHPHNPRYPTWWHVRDYGLFGANPFGIHDFEKKTPKAGDLTIPAGQSVTFRYRLILHEGDEKQAGIAGLYRDYTATKTAR